MSHSLLSPSSAHRWIECPGSIALTTKLGIKNERSVFSDQGTAAHFLAAHCLVNNKKAIASLGHRIKISDSGECFSSEGVEIDYEMVENVQMYVDLIASYNCYRVIEHRVSLAHITNEAGGGGTVDALVIDGDTLRIFDLKYGKGVKVYAENNEQLLLYGIGALYEYDLLGIEHIELNIVQPRLDHIDSWTVPKGYLDDFTKKVKASADIILASELLGDVPALNPGEAQCRFCPAKAHCPTLADHAMDTLNSAEIRGIDNVKLGELLSNANLIKNWLDAITERAYAELKTGNKVPGFKLVAGKNGPREWIDENLVEAKLKSLRVPQSARYKKSLITPAQLEKLVKAGQVTKETFGVMQEYINSREPGPVLALESDKRPAYKIETIEFEDLTKGV